MNAKFHLALPCEDINETRKFYTEVLGMPIGRHTETWIDINLYGNQITFTKSGDFNFNFKDYRLGEHVLPSFHFGLIVDTDYWGELYTKLFQDSQLEVSTEVSFMENKIGEHLSFFIKDPNGYMIEFKSFKSANEIFES
ncbi:bleomycin resistance protein [Seonamhaeicola sediminis]|uniref:Bleomycin resistance protein n=1 Tax=Seonamhaeicola sediminis TaxID=2528206 RepID=A0A562YCT9_9FLAO|nr:VOC family protein [Seonamhaeicola sediminis]TWO31921.1 bleomycin resistance protein [Seonamhaeicola sediminis]